MNIVRFEPAHVLEITAQPAQISEVTADALAVPYGQAWTALLDGRPICSAGVVEVWAGRAYAWALLASDAGPHLLALTREIRCHLARLPFRRVEMAVDAGFDAGARWARLLGFTLETPAPMRGYLPGGRDAWLYARISDGVCNDGSSDRSASGRRDL